LVTRDRSLEDRRVVNVSITSEAIKRLGKLDKPVIELHKKLVGHLSESELRQLSRLLEKARQSLPEEGS
jgi:DNA-binding MarR family transcriptional regulator